VARLWDNIFRYLHIRLLVALVVGILESVLVGPFLLAEVRPPTVFASVGSPGARSTARNERDMQVA
jgi:hypothetical protein